jgi:hypothetical protein
MSVAATAIAPASLRDDGIKLLVRWCVGRSGTWLLLLAWAIGAWLPGSQPGCGASLTDRLDGAGALASVSFARAHRHNWAMSQADPLSAAPDAIPRRDPSGPLRVGDVARAFLRYDSPKIIAVALSAALGARVAIGGYSWRDLVMPLALIALEPITEWLIHVYLLHARPIRVAGRTYDLLAAREHRAHHAAPSELGGVLVPTYALFVFVPAIAAYLLALSFALEPLIGGERLAWWLSGLVVGYAILLAYEWSHFLIHTPYRPRGRYYKVIWRNHRLHHYKNERYWFGVTSNLGDSVLRTNPEQSSVERSPTARSLIDGEPSGAAGR